MKTIKRVRETKIGKQKKNDTKKEVFWLWWLQTYCKELQNKEVVTQQSSNKFEVLTNRVMNIGVFNKDKVRKDKKTILRKEKLRERKKEERKKEISRSKKDR